MLDLAGTGDDGTTGLLGGGRSAKDDPRIEAFGTVDEASSALGLARALSAHARVTSICEELQRGLYAVGAELGTNPEAGKSFVTTGPADIKRLEELIRELEAAAPMPAGFILPSDRAAGGAALPHAGTRRWARQSRRPALAQPAQPRSIRARPLRGVDGGPACPCGKQFQGETF